jgi:hypothetical protein
LTSWDAKLNTKTISEEAFEPFLRENDLLTPLGFGGRCQDSAAALFSQKQ